MSIKTKSIIKTLIKISILSFAIFLAIYFGKTFLSIQKETKNQNNANNNKTTNIENYKNINIDEIASVGVAISTNIGIKYTKKQSLNYSNIYKEIFSIEQILKNDKEVKKILIGENMLFIREYFNFVKTDFNKILKNSNNRKQTLENIINQLEIRFKQSLTTIKYLTSQNKILIAEYNKTKKEIEEIKQNISINYKKTATNAIFKDMNLYLLLKSRETKIKLYIVFINNFISKNNSINAYNKLLLDTLINNKDIISKGSYLVIPDSGSQLLDDFGLIMSEAEYKATKKEEN